MNAEARKPAGTAYEDIRFEVVGPHVARITLARPSTMNAYTSRLIRELADAVQRYRFDEDLRVLVLTGEGTGFCSGGDISGEYERPNRGHPMEDYLDMREVHDVLTELRRLDKPTIAQINGAAVAGGLTLALACDLRIASDRARLGDTSGRAGLLPDEGGAYLFPRFMGLDSAIRMVLLGEVYDAASARDLGLVTEVVPHQELDAHTLRLAQRIASMAPLAVRRAKRMMVKQLDMTWEQSLEDAGLNVLITNPSEDAGEGMRAFQEKRQPRFRGR